MKENMIVTIDNAVRALDLNWSKTNEELFALGVQLGRHLATSGENIDGLPFFKECEEARNCAGRIYDINKKISAIIGQLFYRACSSQINEIGTILFSLESRSYIDSYLPKESIFKRFFIENVTATNYEYSEALLLEFNLCGSVADLFQKYKIRKQWQLVCENPYSKTSVEITSQGKILSHIQPSEAEISQYAVTSSTQIDLAPAEIENNLNSLLDALHKELFFLQISHPI